MDVRAIQALGVPMAKSDKSADQQWIRSVLNRYEEPLTMYAYRIIGDAEMARDVVQETFFRLCKQPPDARERILGHLGQWLYTVCRNAAINVRRKDSRMFSTGELPSQWMAGEESDPARSLEARENRNEVLQALDELPENQREVIRLKFQHGMSYRQISSITGRTTSYVGYLIHAGLKSIREQIAETPMQDTGS